MVSVPSSPSRDTRQMRISGVPMYDVKHLRYFVAVAVERSFTKGAERLNMAQPPLSRRIQDMEDELGTKLFDRDARPLALTPAGQLFYEQALQVIQRAEQMRQTMRRFVAAERPRFVIGLVPSTLYARLPEVLRHFRERAPATEISLVEMSSVEQFAALKDGRINVGFGRVRLEDPCIRREVLREERLIVALPHGHGLSASETDVSLAELATIPTIVYPREPRPSYADQVLSFFHDHGTAPVEVLEVRELQTALVMVASGSGACVVPESVQRQGRTDIDFRALREHATAPIIMSYRAGDPSSDLQALFGTFRDLYREWGLPVPGALVDGEGAD